MMRARPLTGVRQYATVALTFFVLFLVSAILYGRFQENLDRRTLETHARIIANDVWAINPAGVENYLRLAMTTQHYRDIRVSIPGNGHFLALESPELSGIDGFLGRIGLIPTKEMRAAIHHGQLHIGDLRVVQYVRLVFPFFNLLIVCLLLLLLAVLILFLVDRRRTLQLLVQERTRSLLESQHRFHDLVNLLPEMVLETDLEGNISYANNEAQRRFGLSRENDCGSNLFDFFPAAERASGTEQFRKSLEQRTLFQGVLKDREQHELPVLLRSAPIVRDGRCVGARLLLIDITERQRMEQQLSRDRKMKAIGLMAGGVAHDLNNILSGIVSYPELLLLDMADDDPLRRPLTMIHKAGLDASRVVADLLTVARGSRGDSEIVDPNALIREYLDTPDFEEVRCRFPLVNYVFTPAPDLLSLSCSPIHVRKCLMNLVINGFEAIPGEGEVRIVTENVHPLEIAARGLDLSAEQRYIRIKVSDTGRGIEEKDIEHIFEPFYSKKVMGRSGTGLGLTVVWNTVRDHGGLTLVASSGQGTVFELLLPATAGTPLKAGADMQVLRGGGESILVVDDELRQRQIADTLLQTLGYRVRTAANAGEALAALAGEPADLVVLDMIMGPGQPNGRELYRQILAIRPGQKAIIASGYAEDDDVRRTLEMGAAAFVAKPYTIAAMSLAVHGALRAEAPQPEKIFVRLPA